MAVYSARGNGFVPHLRVRAVGVVVHIGIGVHKLAQRKLVMKAARDSGDALERIRFRLTLGEVAAVERGRLLSITHPPRSVILWRSYQRSGVRKTSPRWGMAAPVLVTLI